MYIATNNKNFEFEKICPSMQFRGGNNENTFKTYIFI